MLDQRLLRVAIQVGTNIKYYEDIKIEASGVKYNNEIANEGTIKLTNLDKDTREYILTETTPYKTGSTNQKIIIYAGRESKGYSVVFVGDIFRATISQPPDITLTIRCMTGFANQSNIISVAQGKTSLISKIARDIATSLKLKLSFQATDKNISNYTYNGSAIHQITMLSEIGGINAYIDDDKLIVKDYNKPLSGVIKVVNKDTGMVGIPEITEYGVKVKYLYDEDSSIGGEIKIESELNPAANGNYVIYKLSFDLSNRSTQFYYTAECNRFV